MVNLFRKIHLRVLIACLAGATNTAWPQMPDIEFQKALPIALDADSSEFDRKNDKLTFTGLSITQGPLHIEADDAEASRLDFEDTRWIFSGNVQIENIETKVYCDYAEVLFKDHQILSAVLRGQPARFTQQRPNEEFLTEGKSNVMEYDLQAGVISMTEDAWLSDGANEVSGNKITYDLVKEYIIADSDGSGQVRMKINPPEKIRDDKNGEEAP